MCEGGWRKLIFGFLVYPFFCFSSLQITALGAPLCWSNLHFKNDLGDTEKLFVPSELVTSKMILWFLDSVRVVSWATQRSGSWPHCCGCLLVHVWNGCPCHFLIGLFPCAKCSHPPSCCFHSYTMGVDGSGRCRGGCLSLPHIPDEEAETRTC